MDPDHAWPDRQSLVMVQPKRRLGDDITTETRYFLSRLPPWARTLLGATGGPWGIENSRHWVLDVAFQENDCGLHPYQTPHHMTILRRIALHVRKQKPTTKLGLANKRLKAAWDPDYRLKVLALMLQGG